MQISWSHSLCQWLSLQVGVEVANGINHKSTCNCRQCKLNCYCQYIDMTYWFKVCCTDLFGTSCRRGPLHPYIYVTLPALRWSCDWRTTQCEGCECLEFALPMHTHRRSNDISYLLIMRTTVVAQPGSRRKKDLWRHHLVSQTVNSRRRSGRWVCPDLFDAYHPPLVVVLISFCSSAVYLALAFTFWVHTPSTNSRVYIRRQGIVEGELSSEYSTGMVSGVLPFDL